MNPHPLDQDQERLLMRKIFLRLVPLLMFLYVIAYIDRINVSFAALTMNKDIGLNAAAYGWGAGIFFLGYCLFEVPSNLIMLKVGARRWIARILLTWGLLSCGMAWVAGPSSFLSLRFLLGVAEAGFFPGVILYLTYWFPARYRARIISAFMLSIPVSIVIGAPLSTAILELNGLLGMKGWQWLFIMEALPALLLVIPVLVTLPDTPDKAHWLSAHEKAWLCEELAAERAQKQPNDKSYMLQVITNPTVLALCFIYFCATAANLGLSFFMPQIIKQQGFSNIQVGLLTALPYILGCAGMLAIGHLSDRFNERRWFLTATLLIASAGLAGAGLMGNSLLAIASMGIAAIGIMGCKGPFWPLPSTYLTGAAAAGGIALINSVGNLGGFVGPYMVGYLKDATQTFNSGLYALALLGLVGALLTYIYVRPATADAQQPNP